MANIIRSSQPLFPEADIKPLLAEIEEVLRNGQFRNGKNVKVFEDHVAEYLDVDGAAAFDSDSSAYETALRYFGVAGGEVVVCTNSFVSVPNSVVFAGATPVFADIRRESLSMDPESLRRNITSRTRGVIVTHIAGFPNPDLKEIIAICRSRGLFILEDATHAIGASVEGKKAGGFGDAAVFAFTPTKVITTGEGGMLVTNNMDLCSFAKRYRFYGSGAGKTNFADVGRHMVMPEVSSLLGIYQLRRLDEFIDRRNQIAAAYDEALSEIDGFQTIKVPAGVRCAYYKYPLILGSSINRQQFTQALVEKYGMETGNIFFPPCHMQPAYQNRGVKLGSLPVAEQVLERTIALPMHAALSDGDVDLVLDSINTLALSK
ncbi:MAG: DegT/DnrJ/EryC1/StrS family aminotransferase [Candidatus Bathyarchaeota archaeon]|nr:DegT/DnrJ/EryC1/StrS family aminotransferase [Candidatus Bathyarchaeota archaeon]